MDTKRASLPAFAVVLLVLAVFMTIPDLSAERSVPQQSDTLPGLDHFLQLVNRATPPDARILSVGQPPAYIYIRAGVLLYPRYVFNSVPTDSLHAFVAPPWTWRQLTTLACGRGASYILLWDVPVVSPIRPLIRWSSGRLVRR